MFIWIKGTGKKKHAPQKDVDLICSTEQLIHNKLIQTVRLVEENYIYAVTIDKNC